MFSNRGFGFVLFCFEENCIYQNNTNWRPELCFEKSLLQLTGLRTWLISTVPSTAHLSKACGRAGGQRLVCTLIVSRLGSSAGPFLALVHFCAHIVHMSAACLAPPRVWPRGTPCWWVFRRQTPTCLKPGLSCPRALWHSLSLRAEAAGPPFCFFPLP